MHPRRPRPRSQGSLLPAPRSERERAGRREPWERGCGDPEAVGRVGRRGGTKVFITGERAPGYRLSPDRFQKFKRMPAPDWAQKSFVLLCPIGEHTSMSSFRVFVHDGYCLDHGFSSLCTKEMHAVRKPSVSYKIPISSNSLTLSNASELF